MRLSPETADEPPGRVLHVADADVLARFGPMLEQVLRGLMTRGLACELLTAEEHPALKLAPGVVLHTVPSLAGLRAWRLWRDLPSQITDPPDLVHLWGTAGLGWVQSWAARRHVPILVHALGRRHTERLLRGGLFGSVHLAAACPALAEPIRRRFPLAAVPCELLEPAVDAPPVAPPAAGRVFQVLYAGPVDRMCGVELLVDAVAQLRTSGAEVQGALVGDGPGVPAVWRRLRARGVHDALAMVGEPELWERALPEVDACIIPACQRELSIIPLLAMALGRLVIASRDQLAGWFVEDTTAWQFTPGSAVELAYLLSRAIEQPHQADALRSSARAYARAHYGVELLLERLLNVYARVWGRAGRIQPENAGGRASL